MAKDGHQGAFIFGLLVGLASSAAATMLLTPRSGPALRAEIAGQGDALRSRAQETARHLRPGSEEPAPSAWQVDGGVVPPPDQGPAKVVFPPTDATADIEPTLVEGPAEQDAAPAPGGDAGQRETT